MRNVVLLLSCTLVVPLYASSIKHSLSLGIDAVNLDTIYFANQDNLHPSRGDGSWDNHGLSLQYSLFYSKKFVVKFTWPSSANAYPAISRDYYYYNDYYDYTYGAKVRYTNPSMSLVYQSDTHSIISQYAGIGLSYVYLKSSQDVLTTDPSIQNISKTTKEMLSGANRIAPIFNVGLSFHTNKHIYWDVSYTITLYHFNNSASAIEAGTYTNYNGQTTAYSYPATITYNIRNPNNLSFKIAYMWD